MNMRLLLVALAAFAHTAHAGCKPKEAQLKTMQRFLVVSQCQPYPPHVVVHSNKTYACYEYLMSVVKIDDLLGKGCGAATPDLATSIDMFRKPDSDGRVCYSFCKQLGIKTTKGAPTTSSTKLKTTTQTTTGSSTASTTHTSTETQLVASQETRVSASTTTVTSLKIVATTSVYTSEIPEKLVTDSTTIKPSAASLKTTSSPRIRNLEKNDKGGSTGVAIGVAASLLIAACLVAWLYRVRKRGVQEDDMVVQDDPDRYEIPVAAQHDALYDEVASDSFENPLYDQNERNFGYAQQVHVYDAAC